MKEKLRKTVHAVTFMVLVVLCCRYAAAQALPGPVSMPDIDKYAGQADEIVAGTVVSVEPVNTYEGWSFDRKVKYKYSLSRAIVDADRTFLGTATGRKTVFFTSAVHMAPEQLINPGKVSPQDPEFAWKVGSRYSGISGLPLSFKKGEKVLLFLYRASKPRYENILGSMEELREDPKPALPAGTRPLSALLKRRRNPDIEKEKDTAYLVFVSQDGGMGAKFSLRGPKDKEKFITNPKLSWQNRSNDGDIVVEGTDSLLWEDWQPPKGVSYGEIEPRVKRRLASEGGKEYPLSMLRGKLKELVKTRQSRPRIEVKHAHLARYANRNPDKVQVTLRICLVNTRSKPVTYELVSAQALTPRGRHQVSLTGDYAGGLLDPYKDVTVGVSAEFAFDKSETARIELRLADSEGETYLIKIPQTKIHLGNMDIGGQVH